MNVPARLLCLLPLFLGCAACNSTPDDGPTTHTSSGGTDRNSGGDVSRTGGTTEVADFMVDMPDFEEAIVMVWVGEGCPPDSSTAPTYSTVEPVALPWRPGASFVVDESYLEDGEVTIYVLVIVERDGALYFYEDCILVEAPEEGETIHAPLELHPASTRPDFELLAQRPAAIQPTAEEPEEEQPPVILIIKTSRR